MSIETRGELKTPEEYNNLVVKRDGATFIRLSDIGRAAVGVEDERSVARFNSRPAVGIGIVKQSKANTIDVAKKIKAELEHIRGILPADVYTTIPYDESIFVEKSIHEVWETLGIAFLLVVLTIFIFLHDFRSTLVPSVSIPVSIIATFGMLYVMGYSINTVTMLAFVLAFALAMSVLSWVWWAASQSRSARAAITSSGGATMLSPTLSGLACGFAPGIIPARLHSARAVSRIRAAVSSSMRMASCGSSLDRSQAKGQKSGMVLDGGGMKAGVAAVLML
jgi:hypothetical protein